MAQRNTAPIVVGVDGGELGRRALAWAVEEARRRGCPVQAIHVWAHTPVNDVLLGSVRQMHEQARALLRQEVCAVTEGMEGIPEIVQECIPGTPANVLIEVAQDAAMLVLGRHRGGVARQAFIGSVSSACARRAFCPVVVIPGPRPRRNNAAEG
ncbi:universal stress protein [Allokutzneria albata]|uniref:Nucleotide-binding universal stress protein, UspA family n=1 Tax=Allokutzneria albata TaxID=211114 RepID=A0A1G9SJ89_ALLAB|nr:universal stress protein [Allokutzneria albata]SDM35367.1 Nucleotide-binding universal stress protein, UspA family [Allokutzneria albata]